MTVYASKLETIFFRRCLLNSMPCVLFLAVNAFQRPPFWYLTCHCSLQLELVRTLARCSSDLSQKGDKEASSHLSERMADELMAMPLDEAVPLTRACGELISC